MFKLTRIIPTLFTFDRPRFRAKKTVQPVATPELLADHELQREEQLCCGGYNEAFVIQYWTSYTPR